MINWVAAVSQAMPEKEMKWAEVEAQNADLCISLGSSLVVYPAAAIPVLAKQTGAKYVIINREPTEQDQIADMVINSDIGPLMTDVIERLGV